MSGYCRDCLAGVPEPGRCPACESPRTISHPEIDQLGVAHIDSDAFYASVEKRDDPALRDKPVIVGGGHRGVVSTACYIARLYGVRSAMPMFKALRACPDAVVIRPDMAKYAAVSREARRLMLELTPLVQPLSLDEAFLDLRGTERLHKRSPAASLARLALRIENELGITVSIGLSYNKSMSKLASECDKPRGFAIIGRREARAFLAPRPVSDVWGVGKVMRDRLHADGIHRIGQLQEADEIELVRRYGSIGTRLARFARGEDDRAVLSESETKSVSAETTFASDIAAAAPLNPILWTLCEKVSARLKRQDLAGRTVTVKLKTADFRLRTRSVTLPAPTRLAETLYQAGAPLVAAECDGTAFRLLGIGVSNFDGEGDADQPSLLDGGRARKVEETIDRLRERFGREAIGKGRGLSSPDRGGSPGAGARPSSRTPRNPGPGRR